MDSWLLAESLSNTATLHADVWQLCRTPDTQKYKMPQHPSVPFVAYPQVSDVSKQWQYLLLPSSAMGTVTKSALLEHLCVLRMPSRTLEKIHLNRSSAPSAENTAPQQRERGKGGQVVLGLTRLQICWWKRSAFPSATRRKKGCTRVLGLSAAILIQRWSRCDNEWITDLNYKTPLYLYHYLKHKIARCCMYSGEWTFLNHLAFWIL